MEERILALEEKVEEYDGKIVEAILHLEKVERQVSFGKREVERLQAEVADTKVAYDKAVNQYMERMRSYQQTDRGKNVTMQYLDILLDAQGFTDFLRRVYAVSTVIQHDVRVSDNLLKLHDDLQRRESRLNVALMLVTKKEQEAQEEREFLIQAKQEVEKELEKLEELQRTIEENRVVALGYWQDLGLEAPQVDSEKLQIVLDEAFSHLGVPYVWGGTTPSGFDCSGLVQYVYAKAGVSLPRVAQEQYKVGVQVSFEDLEPGDLIYRSYPSYHIGIYIGNGQYIHAPRTGDVVKIAPFHSSSWESANRVLY